MDHLPLPIDALAHTAWRIPYYAFDGPSYDDLGFLTYPERVGFDLSLVTSDDLGESSPRGLAPFLQEWLWFGLLGETIGIGSRPNVPQRIASRAAFIAEDENGTQVIQTSKLRCCIILASSKNQAPLFNDFHKARYELCVRRALELVSNCLYMWPWKDHTSLVPLHKVLFSVQILAETLLASREILFPSHRARLAPLTSFLHQGATGIVDGFLEKAGWCPYDIGELPSQIVLRHYLSFLGGDSPSRNHSACSRDRCILTPVLCNAISPVHTSTRCLCEDITIEEDTITPITEAGQIPLLTFSELSGGKRVLKILKFSVHELPNFVAISHVRSKGLGNSFSNTLPYCQLSLIQATADDLTASEEQPTPFYIDTMCLPRAKQARKRSLTHHIRNIYRQASKVLVLDPSLFCYSVGSPQECLIRIKYSTWAKRLWTIQEGVLAQSLCFKFSNGIKCLDDILADYEKRANVFFQVPRRTAYVQPYWLNSKTLSTVLTCLEDDVKAAELRFKEGEEKDVQYDKQKLRVVLRLGYLTSPRLSWMVDEERAWKSRRVLGVLDQVYMGRNKAEIAHCRIDAADPLLERLKVIGSVDLETEVDGSWGLNTA